MSSSPSSSPPSLLVATNRPLRILLAVTGSVATIKIQELIDRLVYPSSVEAAATRTEATTSPCGPLAFNEVRVIMTEHSKHFFQLSVPDVKGRAGGKGSCCEEGDSFITRLNQASLNERKQTADDCSTSSTEPSSSSAAPTKIIGNENSRAERVTLFPHSLVVPGVDNACRDHHHAGEVFFYDDSCEYSAWQGRGDSVLHIDLKDWADILVVAPASANTIAKAANGICDNLLMCVLRAWPCRGSWQDPTPSPQCAWTPPIRSSIATTTASDDNTASTSNGDDDAVSPSRLSHHDEYLFKPLILAPAMNTNMLYHPATRAHFTTLNTWYNGTRVPMQTTMGGGNSSRSHPPLHYEQQLYIAKAVRKLLACGVEGDGAMASPLDISNLVERVLAVTYHCSPHPPESTNYTTLHDEAYNTNVEIFKALTGVVSPFIQ